jgi:hypothetical protein
MTNVICDKFRYTRAIVLSTPSNFATMKRKSVHFSFTVNAGSHLLSPFFDYYSLSQTVDTSRHLASPKVNQLSRDSSF